MEAFSPVLSESSIGSAGRTLDSTLEATVDANSPVTTLSDPRDSSMTPGTSAISDSRLPPQTVQAACLACRSKHLKCDGTTPCSRCRSSNSECIYVASRRGYKGHRKNQPTASAAPGGNPNKRHASASPPSSSGTTPTNGIATAAAPDSCPMFLRRDVGITQNGGAGGSGSGAGGGSASNGASTSSSMASTPLSAATFDASGLVVPPAALGGAGAAATAVNVDATLQAFRGNAFATTSNGSNMSLVSAHAGPSASGAARGISLHQPSLAERAVDAFYFYFHPGHPFVLPKEYLLRLSKEQDLRHLMAAIRYIGSLYLEQPGGSGPTRATFFDEAVRLAYAPTTPRDGFLVQTLLLLAIGLDGDCQQDRARQMLAVLERTALEINIHMREYATLHGRGNPVVEESWRRTWWDLYVVDGMIAGVHRATTFLLFDVPSDVGLPCEEAQYLSGNIPVPRYMEDFDDQLFSGDEREFSSFAYRIAAIRILGRFMRVGNIVSPDDENLSRLESMLSNWRMHLPGSKKSSVDKNCQLDEMMFQAHYIIHATSILLHQPHSQLDTSPTRTVTSCAPHRPVASGDVWNNHTRHTLTSACEVSKMVTYAVPSMLQHSHFFTCVVTLSSIVHLSKWALYYYGPDGDDLRELIRLNIGALVRLADVWKAARSAGGQIKAVAQEIYRSKKAQQISPAFWVGFSQEEIMTTIAADESIMSEFDNLQQVTNLIQ